MKRKLLALLLAMSMVVGVFAGCSGDSGKSSSTADTSTSSTTDESGDTASDADTSSDTETSETGEKNIPEVTSEPLSILLWDHATEDPAKSRMESAVARFMEAYPNVTVEEVHQQNDNYKQQLIVAMSSGKCPNMYIHWGGGPMAEYYNSGFVNDLTEMFNTYDHPDFIEAAVAQSTYEDKVLAIPYGGLSGADIFYNKNIFAEVGVEVPQTIDELEAVADKLKEAGYTPFSLANSPGWTGSMYFMYLVARHSGNDEFDAAYTQEGSFTSDAFIYAGEKIQEWVEKGYFPEGVNSLSPDDSQDLALMYDGTCAMMLQGSWVVSSMNADNAEWYSENIGVFRFPEDSEAAANGVPQNVEVGTAIGNGISFNCFNSDGSVNQTMLDAGYVLATQFINDQTYLDNLVQSLSIPSIEGYDKSVEDPNMQFVAEVFFDASNVQLWYDQYLPASVTEVHKDCMNALYALEITPEEIGQKHDAAMQEYLNG